MAARSEFPPHSLTHLRYPVLGVRRGVGGLYVLIDVVLSLHRPVVGLMLDEVEAVERQPRAPVRKEGRNRATSRRAGGTPSV